MLASELGQCWLQSSELGSVSVLVTEAGNNVVRVLRVCFFFSDAYLKMSKQVYNDVPGASTAQKEKDLSGNQIFCLVAVLSQAVCHL